MKQNTLLITLTVVVLILLVGCGVAPAPEPTAAAVDAAEVTTRAVKAEPVLIASAEHTPGAWQASLTQGQAVIGRFEAQPLPNGEIAIKLESDACLSSSLIVSAGEVQGLWHASLTQGQAVVGLYEIQPLPNGEVAIKFKKANVEGGLSCRSM